MKRPAELNEAMAMAAARKLNDGLRRELLQFSRAKVRVFVRCVGGTICMHDVMRRSPSETARRKELEKQQKAVVAFMRNGLAFVGAIPYPKRLGQEVTEWTGAQSASEALNRARKAAFNAVCDYGWEIRLALCGVSPQPRARPSADASGLLAQIAQDFRTIFKTKPTSTPGGTFANVAVLVLESAFGKKPRDVTRQVRAAIKACDESRTKPK